MRVQMTNEMLRRGGTLRGGSRLPKSAMISALLLFSILFPLTAIEASAQTGTVQRKIAGAADQDIRIGVYVNVKPDCTAGALPTIRLVKPPAHGKVTVKQAKVKATNYKQCLALEVPGYVGFYRSRANFRGEDLFTFEVAYPGRIVVQQFTVTVGDAKQGLGI